MATAVELIAYAKSLGRRCCYYLMPDGSYGLVIEDHPQFWRITMPEDVPAAVSIATLKHAVDEKNREELGLSAWDVQIIVGSSMRLTPPPTELDDEDED